MKQSQTLPSTRTTQCGWPRNHCPCGSGHSFAQCCGRWLTHHGAPAPSAEALMRSRYSAYVLKDLNYLLKTWHPDTRPVANDLGGTTLRWIGLEIVRTEHGSEQDSVGVVEFIASYAHAAGGKRLHEVSRFVRAQGCWLYVDGDCRLSDILRNGRCPCGSGRKFKRCCGLIAR
ncbi:MAG: YchJ family metal-binding protein [Mariprofundales bacterium]|nr:YchJ family metal-binding protein [Mariprofundales bacterium]